MFSKFSKLKKPKKSSQNNDNISDTQSVASSSSPALAAMAAPLEPREYDYAVNVLVIGLGESGKTTLQRQLDVLYGTKMLDPKYYQRLIYGNTIATLIRLIENAERVNITFTDENAVKRILATPIELAKSRLPRFPLRLGYDCKCLWEDPNMQTMFHYANCCPDYRTPGRTKYYMENVFRVFSPEFTPNRLDIISAYEQVDHPQRSTLTYRRLRMELTCAPTKPIHRKDWNAIAYHEPHYLFYVVSLKDYHPADEILNESLIPMPTCHNHSHNNILLDSLSSFESFSNSAVFDKVNSIYLIFNTSDAFVEKLKMFDLKLCFNDYSGGNDYPTALNFIINKFTTILNEKNKSYQSYVINLLDQEDIKTKFDLIIDNIIPDAENRGLYESIPTSSLHPTSVLPHPPNGIGGVKPLLNENIIEISTSTTSTTSTRAGGNTNNSISSAMAASSLDDDTTSNASTSTNSSVNTLTDQHHSSSTLQSSSEYAMPPLSLNTATPPKKQPKPKVDKKELRAEKQREKEQARIEKEREKEALSEQKRADKENKDKERERLRLEKEQQQKELKEKKAAAAAAAAVTKEKEPTPAATTTTTNNNNASGTTKKKAKGKGFTVQSGFTSIQGRRKNMEDAHMVIDNLSESFKPLMPADEGTCSYYGVYDGHGGTQTAQALEPIVHKCIIETTSFKSGNYEQSMKDGFDVADRTVIPVCEKSGSTGVAAMIIGNTLYTANVGDSECVLARQTPTSSSKSPVYESQLLTYKHLANDEKEKIRITEMGGMIIFGRLFGSLAVARSFGDREYKEGEKKFVTSEPYTRVVELTPKDHYIIMGCDGLWDKVNYDEAVTMCSKLHKQGKNAKEISEALVNDSFDKGSTDNITVIVVILNWK